MDGIRLIQNMHRHTHIYVPVAGNQCRPYFRPDSYGLWSKLLCKLNSLLDLNNLSHVWHTKGLSYPERVAPSRKNNGRAYVMILCSMNVFVVDLTPQKKRLLNSVDIFCLLKSIPGLSRLYDIPIKQLPHYSMPPNTSASHFYLFFGFILGSM